jgi:hypothetical protein
VVGQMDSHAETFYSKIIGNIDVLVIIAMVSLFPMATERQSYAGSLAELIVAIFAISVRLVSQT